MPKFKIEVKGFEEAAKMLIKLPDNLQKRVIKSALRRAAQPLLASAREKVPYDEGVLWDNLKIAVMRQLSSQPDTTSAMVNFWSKKGTPKDQDTFYGRFVHEGTVKQQANPFLERAYDESWQTMESKFADEMTKAVSAFVNRNAKKIKL